MLFTKDKNQLNKHFQKDPILFAYHIGDLDDFFFPLCKWPALHGDNGDIEEAILIYNNPLFVTIMAFGLTDKFGSFLDKQFENFPDEFFCHYHKKYRDIFLSRYDETALGNHLKMKLNKYVKCHDDDDSKINRLGMKHLELVQQFYSIAYSDGYFDPRMLMTNRFFGYIEDNTIQSIAGLHVYSDNYNIAVLGSIATHPDFRGRGIATKVTSKASEELSKENKMICLNVKDDNIPALKCYKKIGFETVHEYEEARFSLRR